MLPQWKVNVTSACECSRRPDSTPAMYFIIIISMTLAYLHFLVAIIEPETHSLHYLFESNDNSNGSGNTVSTILPIWDSACWECFHRMEILISLPDKEFDLWSPFLKGRWLIRDPLTLTLEPPADVFIKIPILSQLDDGFLLSVWVQISIVWNVSTPPWWNGTGFCLDIQLSRSLLTFHSSTTWWQIVSQIYTQPLIHLKGLRSLVTE